MRLSIKAGRRLGLAVAASVLLSGSALAAATLPAQAAPPPPVLANTITLSANPGPQTTDPIGTAAPIAITATETDPTATLTFAVAGAPAGPFSFAGEPLLPGSATEDLDAAFTEAYTGTVTVTVSDSDSAADTVTEDFTWTAENTITVTSPGATTEPMETAIDLPLTATDDAGATAYPLTWSASPALALLGLTIGATNADGTEAAITGTVPAADVGAYEIAVTATDADLEAGSATFELTLGNDVSVTNPGTQTSVSGTAITPLAIAATDTDAVSALAFTAAGLPTGLVINKATGVISGRPTAAETYNVTVTAADDTGATDTAAFTWTIGKPDKVAVTVPASKTVRDGTAVSAKVSATDSAAGQRLTWSATGLPPGLKINPTTGVISGRPTKLGKFTSQVRATDGTGASGTATMKWTVAASFFILNPGTQTTTVGQWQPVEPFTYTDFVAGDKPTFSATGLPAGMGFQAKPALLYGWPNSSGTYHVTIHERGSLGSVDAMTFKLVVTSAAIGGSGEIHLPFAGKCLEDPGSRTANFVHVELADCASGAAKSWNVGSDNTVRVYGRCLTIAGSGRSAGRQLEISSCAGSARQRWAQGSVGELVNPASGLCVTDPGSSRRNGTVPTMGACHARSYEQWTLPAQRVLTAVGGSCADDHYTVDVNGNVIDMFFCKYSLSKWTFEPDGTIRMFGNKCVTVRSGKAVIWTCGSHSGQKWTVVRTSAMGSELAQGGVCLAIPSMTAKKGTLLENNGTQLITSKCSNTDPRDLWHIE